jgi:hypothetical protein
LDKKLAAIKAPATIPATKKRFQASFFQSYRKKDIFPGKHTAQIWRRDEEIPKALLPSNNRAGTISPISGPPTYQGQGCFNQSTTLIVVQFGKN